MARPGKDEIATRQFHKAVQALVKKRNIHAKPVDIMLWAFAERGGTRVSDESIRKAHVGEVDPNQCAIELLLVMRDFYKAGPGELGEVAQRRIDTVMAYVTPPTPGGQESDASGWLRGTTRGHLRAVG